MFIVSLSHLLFIWIFAISVSIISADWTWTCNVNSGLCVRTRQDENTSNYKTVRYESMDICRLTCGKYGSLWPRPTGTVVLATQVVPFTPSDIIFDFEQTPVAVKSFMDQVKDIFINDLIQECGPNCETNTENNIFIHVILSSSDLDLTWTTDESYNLEIVNKDGHTNVEISAVTVYGARHGLESLTQLVAARSKVVNQRQINDLVMVESARVRDRPAFVHRGLMLDTARNFIPLEAILRQLEAMRASKLNVFHWHVTDSHSFPLVIPRVPQLSRTGAYLASETYSPEDVKRLVDAGRVRGIRVLPELDAPSHSGNGWQWGPEFNLGNLSVCTNEKPWRQKCIQPPCGQLNPVNPNIYNVLSDVYHDMIDAFPPKGAPFHMGGDEVFFPCWNTTDEIIKYLQDHGRGRTERDFLELWSEFQTKALNAFDGQMGHSNTPILLWTSHLTNPDLIEEFLDKRRYVIEPWLPAASDIPDRLLAKGYRIVVATKDAWYLDHGFWGTTEYHSWRVAYSNKLPRHPGVLGGEVCMWSEYVDESGLDARIWPRAAAAAERLWSDPDSDTRSAEPRLFRLRDRLVARGVASDAIAPEWCVQNEGECT